MVDQKLPLPSIYDFATWAPVLRLPVDSTPDRHGAASVRVSGRIGRHGWSLAVRRPRRVPGRAAQVEDVQDEFDEAQRVQGALADVGTNDISFRAEVWARGRTVLHLLGPSPAVEPGIGSAHPGALILVEG